MNFKYYFLALLVIPLAYAWMERWISDDAFISFRYAKNFASGLGLVYNAGEYVEGYTNFLWTILLSGYIRLNGDPVFFSYAAGILFYLLTLLILFFFSLSFHNHISAGNTLIKHTFIPAAFLAWSFHRHGAIFATSGLETMMFTFLITSGYLLLFFISLLYKDPNVKENKIKLLIIWTLSLLTAAALTRPEGILYLLYGLFYLFMILRLVRISTGIAATSLLIYALYFIWRFSYYGRLFPNTFYAKSGADSYWIQGFHYFYIYFKSYIILLLPLAGSVFLAVYLIIYKLKKRKPENSFPYFFHWMLLSVPFLIHIVYIIKVGGDFMFARFFIPVTPFFLIGTEILLAEYLSKYIKNIYIIIISFLLIPLSVLLYREPFSNKLHDERGIVHENLVYRRKTMQKVYQFAKTVSPFFKDNSIKLAFDGGFAFAVYYLEPVLAIEAATGLTDSYIANLPVETRSRVGHEKKAPPEYLIKRGVHLFTGRQPGFSGKYLIVKNNNFPDLIAEFTIINDIPDLDRLIKKYKSLNIEIYLESDPSDSSGQRKLNRHTIRL